MILKCINRSNTSKFHTRINYQQQHKSAYAGGQSTTTNPVDTLLHAPIPRLNLLALVLLLPLQNLQHKIQTILTHTKPRHGPAGLGFAYVL